MVDKPVPSRVPRRARKKKASVDTKRQVVFNYRGQPIEDILALSHQQQLELMPSRARRFFKRGLDEETQ